MSDSAGGYWRLKGLFFSDNWIGFSGYGWFFQGYDRFFNRNSVGFSIQDKLGFLQGHGLKMGYVKEYWIQKKKVD